MLSCLTTARYSGVDAAETELQTWAGHTVVVVGRFDRIRDAGGVLRRVHQEDLHQAAGDYEASIYQGDDGDGHDPAGLARLLRAHSTEPARDVAALFDAPAFNWLICNTDAHAKNYSVLLVPNAARLAPREASTASHKWSPRAMPAASNKRSRSRTSSALPTGRSQGSDGKADAPTASASTERPSTLQTSHTGTPKSPNGRL